MSRDSILMRGRSWSFGAVVLLAVTCGTFGTTAINLAGTTRCGEVAVGSFPVSPHAYSCFDGSALRKILVEVLIGAGAVLAAVAAGLILFHLFTGRRGLAAAWVAAAGLVLGGAAIVIGVT